MAESSFSAADSPAEYGLPMVVSSARMTRVNRAFEGLFGAPAETGPRGLLPCLHADDRERFEQALERGVDVVEVRLLARDGVAWPFRFRIRNENGELSCLGAFDRDDATTWGSEKRSCSGSPGGLPSTLEAMVHIVEAKNPGLRCSILLVDREHQRVTVGAGPSLPVEYNAAVEGLLVGPTVGSCGTAAFWNFPIVVENIAEDPLWSDLRDAAAIAGVSACWSHPIPANNGDVLGAMALYCDEPRAPKPSQMDGLEIAARMVGLAIERERLEEKLRQTAKMEALGVLAGGIAHDFNNLLATILGNAELTMETVPHGSKARGMLSEIVTASGSATELCNQMLAYAGRGAMTSEPLDANAIVRELGGLLQVGLSKKVTLEYDLVPRSAVVVADRSQLRQVLMNLITNAAEAIGNQAGQIRVATTLRELEKGERAESGLPEGDHASFVQLTVSDTGCGMDSETSKRVFDPFYSTKSGSRGLGLAAVQGILRGHGGSMRFESEPGVGTTAVVLLPCSQEPLVELVPSGYRETTSLRGKHVLVVDDESKVRATLAELLSHSGVIVTEAEDGVEALRLYRASPDGFDVVLLDLSMPKLDGEEVFQELRAIRPDVRVVLISGYTEQEILDRFQGSGLAGVLQKPARRDVLLERMGKALRVAAPSADRLAT